MADSPPAAPARIFISYRQAETAYAAGWLFDRLADHFGDSKIFKDVDSIGLGDDFVEVITNAVGSCDVLLALIGSQWLTITNENGLRRLDDPDDFVRLEIEAALARDVRLIPILVDGARMPRADELPPSLANLVRRQALELSPSRFDFDTGRLLRKLDETLVEVRTAQGDPVSTSEAAEAHDARTTEVQKTPEPPSAVAPLASAAADAPETDDAQTRNPTAESATETTDVEASERAAKRSGPSDEPQGRSPWRSGRRLALAAACVIAIAIGAVVLLVSRSPDTTAASPPDEGLTAEVIESVAHATNADFGLQEACPGKTPPPSLPFADRLVFRKGCEGTANPYNTNKQNFNVFVAKDNASSPGLLRNRLEENKKPCERLDWYGGSSIALKSYIAPCSESVNDDWYTIDAALRQVTG